MDSNVCDTRGNRCCNTFGGLFGGNCSCIVIIVVIVIIFCFCSGNKNKNNCNNQCNGTDNFSDLDCFNTFRNQ